MLFVLSSPLFSQSGSDEKSAADVFVGAINIGTKIMDIFNPVYTERDMEGGGIKEGGLGVNYSKLLFGKEAGYSHFFSGSVFLRYTGEISNEAFDETLDESLNMSESKIWEWFILPLKFSTAFDPFRFSGALGLYVESETLKEKGYFVMPELAELVNAAGDPFEPVNSFTNDFSMSAVGPLLESGIDWKPGEGNIDLSLTLGLVPVFNIKTAQEMTMKPLMEPAYAEYSQDTTGGPYFYLDAELILFKYVSLSFLFGTTTLKYKTIDFNDGLEWYTPERAVVTNSFKTELALLIPTGFGNGARIGGGFAADSVTLDGGEPLRRKRWYFIFSIKRQ